MLRSLYEYLRSAFPINRVVALLAAPAATLAGLISAWLADHLPFIAQQVDSGELTAIFLGGAAAVVALAYKWLDGWQKYQEELAVSIENDRERRAGSSARVGR